MTRGVRFAVVPDRDGGWSVTRDRVVTASDLTRAAAVRYAIACVRDEVVEGGAVVLEILRANGAMGRERRYRRSLVAPNSAGKVGSVAT